jgi:hypothetical protein
MGNLLKGPDDHLVIGDYNAVCSMCGAKRKASKMVLNWMGQWRCPQHNEPRQPQDFVRGVPDIVTPPWVQKPTSTYLQICTYNGISAIPGLAIPGCMIPGRAIWDQDFNPPIPPPTLNYNVTTDTNALVTDQLGNQVTTQ